MTVRSSSTPARPATTNAAGIATGIDQATSLRHRRLHDVRRVSAEHHHLAVRHVDDAHDPEGDRESRRGKDQHRAEASPKKSVSMPREHAASRVDALHGRGRGRAHRGIALAEAAVRRRLDQGGQPIAHVGAESVRQRGHGPQTTARVLPIKGGQRQRGLDLARNRSIGLAARASPEQLDRGVVERAHHVLHGGQSDARIRTGEREPRDSRSEEPAQAIVRPDLRQRVRRGGTDGSQRHWIEELEGRQALIDRPGDDDCLVFLDEQTVFQHRGEQGSGAG